MGSTTLRGAQRCPLLSCCVRKQVTVSFRTGAARLQLFGLLLHPVKCPRPRGVDETTATAIAACSRPIARQASPQIDLEIPSSSRSQSAASTISGHRGELSRIYGFNRGTRSISSVGVIFRNEPESVRDLTNARLRASSPCRAGRNR